MLLCLTVRVSYSPSRAVDIPWGEYLWLQHRREQDRREAVLSRIDFKGWRHKVTFHDDGRMSITPRWFIKHKRRLIRIGIMAAMLLLTYYLGITPFAVPLANRYHVGVGAGQGTRWDRALNWASSSGGSGGAGVPTVNDDVFFDTNSNADCEVDIDAICMSFDADSNYDGDFDTAGFNLSVANGFSYAGTGTFTQGSGIMSVGSFSYTGSGSFDNFGFVESDGNFTMTGTWNDNGGTIDIDDDCTWNASLTTTVLEWDAPNGTITVTGGNTIVVVDTLILLGNSGNAMTITAASNFTIDLGASITVKTAIHCDIDHMQLGAGDTLTVFSGTDNGNNDADITFSAYDRIANASGAFDDNAKWDGGNAPVSGVSFDIPATITMTIQGNEASAGAGISGTLIFDGQADSAVAQLTIDGGEVLEVLSGGAMDTTGTGSTGYAKILSSDANDIHCHGEGTITLGPEFHFDTVHITHGTVANSEKVVLDGDCEWHNGFTVASGGEVDDGGNTLTVENGNLDIAASGYTATGTLILAGTHSLAGAGLSFNIIQVGTSPGVTTLEADLSGVDLTIANGDELDTNTFNVTMTGDVDNTGTFTGSTGTHSHGTLTNNSGGTYSSTTGTLTLTNVGEGASIIWNKSGGTFTPNGGTVDVEDGDGGNEAMRMEGTGGFYNFILSNNADISTFGANITVGNDVTVESGSTLGLGYPGVAPRTWTVTGGVNVAGTLDGTIAPSDANQSFGSLTISAGGTYTGTSLTTTITSETAGGYAILVDAAGTYTHSSGTIDVATATATNIDFGGDSPYNFTYSGGSTGTMVTNNTTVANAFSITDGDLDTGTTDFNVTGTSTIGDGAGASSSAQFLCNSSAIDTDGDMTVNSDGNFSLPDASGSFLFAGAIKNFGTVTHNDGTATSNLSAGSKRINDDGSAVEFSFYNLVLNGTSDSRRLEVANDLTVENQITVTLGRFRLRSNDRAMTLTMGTTSQSGTILNNSNFDLGGGANTVTIQAASAEFPIIYLGTDIDWDIGSDPSISDMVYNTAATTGGGGVTITLTRCKFTVSLDVSSGDIVKIPTGTVSGFRKMHGAGTLQVEYGGGVYVLDDEQEGRNVLLPTTLPVTNICPRFIQGVIPT